VSVRDLAEEVERRRRCIDEQVRLSAAGKLVEVAANRATD